MFEVRCKKKVMEQQQQQTVFDISIDILTYPPLPLFIAIMPDKLKCAIKESAKIYNAWGLECLGSETNWYWQRKIIYLSEG